LTVSIRQLGHGFAGEVTGIDCRKPLSSDDVRGEALPTGHYVNEEAPDQVLAWFLRFFEA
jgi:hypothetical protein